MARFMRLSQVTVNADAILLVRHKSNRGHATLGDGVDVFFAGCPELQTFYGDDAAKILTAVEEKQPDPKKTGPQQSAPAK